MKNLPNKWKQTSWQIFLIWWSFFVAWNVKDLVWDSKFWLAQIFLYETTTEFFRLLSFVNMADIRVWYCAVAVNVAQCRCCVMLLLMQFIVILIYIHPYIKYFVSLCLCSVSKLNSFFFCSNLHHTAKCTPAKTSQPNYNILRLAQSQLYLKQQHEPLFSFFVLVRK